MLPVLFVSHGSPMLALEPGPWGAALSAFAEGLSSIRAVLVVSAHWEAPGPVRITSAASPGVMHDFGGFPDALYRLDYPSPGDPALAAALQARLEGAGIPSVLDDHRPLDHGAWVPLRSLFPQAHLPVLQVSLPLPRTSHTLLDLGRALAPLREEGVLIVASGGIVHNLRRLDWRGDSGPEPWAEAFEAWVEGHVAAGTAEALADGLSLAPHRAAAVPTPEHFDPLLVALGAAGTSMPHTLHQGWQLGSLSLRGWSWG